MKNFKDLGTAFEILDSGDYQSEDKRITISTEKVCYVSIGDWSIQLGGYDSGYTVSYQKEEILRINYEYKEYERLSNFSNLYIKKLLTIMEANKFTRIED